MAVYPTISIQVKISNVWTSITDSVIGDQNIEYGFASNNPTDRLASVGTFRFTLINYDQKFTPGAIGSLSGWRKGLPIRLIITYKEPIIKFSGYISEINLDSKNKLVNVIACDWFEKATDHQLQSPAMVFDQRIDQLAKLVVEECPFQPDIVQYNLGSNNFICGFENLKAKSTAMSELSKLVNSEWGKAYLKNKRLVGNILVVDGKNSEANVSPTQVPIWDFCLLAEDGTYLLAEDGSKLVDEQYESPNIIDTMYLTESNYGDNIINRTVFTIYPKEVDNETQILYSLTNPLYIEGNSTTVITLNYASRNGSSKTIGKEMIQPEAYTDFRFYDSPTNQFVEFTSNLIVTADFSNLTYAVLTIQNTAYMPGYMQLLQLRGKGIFYHESESVMVEDTTSINAYADSEINIDQKYQDNSVTAQTIAQKMVTQEKDPRTVINGVEFLANTDDQKMRQFIYLDIGDMIVLWDYRSNIIGKNFWIRRLKFTIKQGGIIYFGWTLSAADNVGVSYWKLGDPILSVLNSTTRLY